MKKCPKCGEEMHEAKRKRGYSTKEETYMVCNTCGYGIKKSVLEDRGKAMNNGKIKEIIVRIKGYEKIKVKGCKHKELVLACDGKEDYAYCQQCGLRTPAIPHRNDAWAEEIFKQAEKEGELFRDFSHLEKTYFLDKEENKISSSLGYVAEGEPAWWL